MTVRCTVVIAPVLKLKHFLHLSFLFETRIKPKPLLVYRYGRANIYWIVSGTNSCFYIVSLI
jgi:hypothetical protein